MTQSTSRTPVIFIGCIYLFVCQVLTLQTEAIPVYSLKLETCSRGGPSSGTHTVLRVQLYNKNGSISKKFNVSGGSTNEPKKDVFHLNKDSTIELGPICGIDLVLNTTVVGPWKLKHLSVRNWASGDEAIFTENKCAENEFTFRVSNYQREAPQWEPWSSCGCETKVKRRIRIAPNCKGLNWTASENKTCQPIQGICFAVTLIIIIPNVVFGVNILFLLVVALIFCKTRRYGDPAIQLDILGYTRGLFTPQKNMTPTEDSYVNHLDTDMDTGICQAVSLRSINGRQRLPTPSEAPELFESPQPTTTEDHKNKEASQKIASYMEIDESSTVSYK